MARARASRSKASPGKAAFISSALSPCDAPASRALSPEVGHYSPRPELQCIRGPFAAQRSPNSAPNSIILVVSRLP